MILIAMMIGMVLGALLLRRKALVEGTTAMIEPTVKTVCASVDGKPVHSYVVEE